MPRELTIQHAHDLATQHDGYCLDTEWKGTREKYKWKCKEGHIWFSLYTNIQQGQWCPECAIVKRTNKRRLIEEDFHSLAKKRDGECLFAGKTSSDKSSKWKCKEGHVWFATYNNIQRDHWCPNCARQIIRKHLDTKEYHLLAKERGGECLFVGENTMDKNSKWKCREGHIWSAPYHNIKQNHWCPVCGKSSPKIIENYHQLAKERGFDCLFVGKNTTDSFSKWKCKEGHIWNACFSNISHMRGCPHCSKRFPKAIQDYHNIAQANNGKCLIVGQNVMDNKAQWQCDKGHIWNATYESVNQGHWCPQVFNWQKSKSCSFHSSRIVSNI